MTTRTMNPVVVIDEWENRLGVEGKRAHLFCPGCLEEHVIEIDPKHNAWEWNGDLDFPSFNPSILYYNQCHSFLINGVWEFLSDSDHFLAGYCYPAIPVPDWMLYED